MVDQPPDDKSRHQLHSEERAAKAARVAETMERRKREEARIRVAVDQILKTEAGRILFSYLFHLCGYNRSSIAVDPVSGEVQTVATQHNEAMRLVYLKLRSKASRALLAPVEDAAESTDATQEK